MRPHAYVSHLTETHLTFLSRNHVLCRAKLRPAGLWRSPGQDIVTLILRGQAFSEGRVTVNLRIQLSSATTSLYHLYCTHLLIQQILY